MKKILLGIIFLSLAINSNLQADDYEDSEKACNRGSGYACYEMGFYSLFGAGTRKDPIEAVKYFKKSCIEEKNLLGCNLLADCYLKGEGVEKNLDRAMELYELLCANNFGGTCNKVNELKETRSIEKKGTSSIDKIIESDVSIKNLRMTFYDHRNILINKLSKKGYTQKETNHIMNYFFYYNERSIAWLRIMKNEGDFYIYKFFRFNYLMNLEANSEIKDTKENDLDLFKDVLPFNRTVGSYAYGYFLNNKNISNPSEYLDGNETASDKLVF